MNRKGVGGHAILKTIRFIRARLYFIKCDLISARVCVYPESNVPVRIQHLKHIIIDCVVI